jgi:DNA-3-methyladenine glycosylase II
LTVTVPPGLKSQTRYFGALVSAILGQQISVKAARSIRARLEALVPAGQEMTPDLILSLTPEQLRAAGLSRAKALYVVDLAEKVRNGTLDLALVAEMPDEDVADVLTRVKGIGRWTADMFLIFCLGRCDVLPVGDLGLRAAAQRVYSLSALPDPRTLRAIAEPWRPYRSVATWYLWRSLDNTPAT